MTKNSIRTFWRTKYPWFLVLYIAVFGILRGLMNNADPMFAMDLLMWAAFTSYVFLYIFYIFGVRPEELYKTKKK